MDDTSANHSQVLVEFTDTSNNHTVKLPGDWSSRFPDKKNEVKLIVQEKTNKACSSNFLNIKIIDSSNTTFKKVYGYQLSYWSKYKDSA